MANNITYDQLMNPSMMGIGVKPSQMVTAGSPAPQSIPMAPVAPSIPTAGVNATEGFKPLSMDEIKNLLNSDPSMKINPADQEALEKYLHSDAGVYKPGTIADVGSSIKKGYLAGSGGKKDFWNVLGGIGDAALEGLGGAGRYINSSEGANIMSGMTNNPYQQIAWGQKGGSLRDFELAQIALNRNIQQQKMSGIQDLIKDRSANRAGVYKEAVSKMPTGFEMAGQDIARKQMEAMTGNLGMERQQEAQKIADTERGSYDKLMGNPGKVAGVEVGAPPIGTVETDSQGRKVTYVGGNPGDKNNWKVQ